MKTVVALITLAIPASLTAQDILFVGVLRETVVVPLFRYDGDRWQDLQLLGDSWDSRSDSLTRFVRQLPNAWGTTESAQDTLGVLVGPGMFEENKLLRQPIRQVPEKLAARKGQTTFVFSRAGVVTTEFYDERRDVLLWQDLIAVLRPMFDSLETAWIETARREVGRMPLPDDRLQRERTPPVFTELRAAGDYVSYELQRAYRRPPTRPDPNCWDSSVLSGWVRVNRSSARDVQVIHMQNGFHITDCDRKGEGYMALQFVFQAGTRSFVAAFWHEYDSEGFDPVILQLAAGEVRRVADGAGVWMWW